MREIVHLQVGQCGNQIGSKVSYLNFCSQRKKMMESILEKNSHPKNPIIQ